jgi:hypothetical protein
MWLNFTAFLFLLLATSKESGHTCYSHGTQHVQISATLIHSLFQYWPYFHGIDWGEGGDSTVQGDTKTKKFFFLNV